MSRSDPHFVRNVRNAGVLKGGNRECPPRLVLDETSRDPMFWPGVIMQNGSKGLVVLALLIITLGVGWLLTTLAVEPRINWVLTLSLGMIGVLAFVISGGLDKVSVVVGPVFLSGSVLSFLRQANYLSFDVEIPIYVIVVGVLLLVSQLRVISLPGWYIPPKATDES